MADPNAEYGPPLAGSFNWPRPGSPGSFGYRRSASHMHAGVDIQAPEGRPWKAVADGVIRNVVTAPGTGFAGYGRAVVLEHVDGRSGRPVFFLYAHGQSVTVAPGQVVTKGQELGKVGRSQFARRPTRPEGSMGPHLHFEASTHSYPQGAEARTRVDPGVLLGAYPRPSTPPATPPPPPAPRPSPTTPAPEDLVTPDGAGELLAKQQLRVRLMARLIQTDVEVNRIQRQLVAAGHPIVASGLGALWSQSRGRLWPLLNRSSRLEEIRAAVLEWLERIETAARQAAAAVPEGMRAAVEAIRARLRAIWEAGIDWAEGTARELAQQAAVVIVGGSVTLFLFAAWVLSKRGKL